MDSLIQTVFMSIFIFGVQALENELNNEYIKLGNDYRNVTSGHLGPWTEWSLCSKSCGFGTQYRLRQCHRLKQVNASCEGDTKQYKICNNRECPPNQDYRSKKCAEHNNIYYGSRRYRWVPYINKQFPCELSCKSVQYRFYARFRTSVEDGVTCNDDNTAACFSGKCMKSGCDGILGSGTRADICGVCGGQGDKCSVVKGIFTRTQLTYRGYNVVTTIPTGARSINITEIGRSKNHLALSTQFGYFLNGNLRLQRAGEVRGAGTVFTYKRWRTGGCRGECLTAKGPLNASVQVELLYFGRNPGIMYSYTIPNKELQEGDEKVLSNVRDTEPVRMAEIQLNERPNYVKDWKTNPEETQQFQQHQDDKYIQDDTPLSRDSQKIVRYKKDKVIGGKKQRRNNSRSNDVIARRKTSKKYNKGRKKKLVPSKKLIKNQVKFLKGNDLNGHKSRQILPYRHYYHTSALDGLGDVPVKSGLDWRIPSSHKSTATSVDSKGLDDRRPDGKRTLPSTLLSKSSASSTSSSSLFSRRRVSNNTPLSRDDLEKNRYNDSETSDLHKASLLNNEFSNRRSTSNDYNNKSSRRRVASEVGEYSWRISGFTVCSEECGGGLQETRVICIKSDSQVEVVDEDCDLSVKPETTTVVCNNQPCEPSWSIDDWSPCSVSCGRGLRNRKVVCQQRVSSSLTVSVSSNKCPQPRPQSRQYCQLDPCYKWKPSNWSQCSTVCGLGQRSRNLTCVNSKGKDVKDSFCTDVKPTKEEICDMGSCAQGWFHSKWTKKCSTDCGHGFYIRKVYCSAPDGSPLDENKCGGRKKPRERKWCASQQPCGGHWYAGPWSKCNDTCGSNAVRHREVLCIKQHGNSVKGITKDHNCDEQQKPLDTEKCRPMPACEPQWYMMAWSNCSKPCDTGIRTREVICLDASLNQNLDCDKEKRPSTRQSCNTLPCHQNFKEFTGSGKTQILQQDGTIIDAPVCEDKNGAKWCRLVSQARLCHYYKENCCQTCRRRLAISKE